MMSARRGPTRPPRHAAVCSAPPPPRRCRAAHNPNEPKGRAAAVKRTIVWRSPPNRSLDKNVDTTKELQEGPLKIS